MANKVVHLPVVNGLGQTLRKDNWWAGPAATVLVLSGFIVYATWRAFEGDSYQWGAYRVASVSLASPGAAIFRAVPVVRPRPS